MTRLRRIRSPFESVARLTLTLALSAASVSACKRGAAPEETDAPAEGEPAPAEGEPARSSAVESRPAECVDVEDCAGRGAQALAAGEVDAARRMLRWACGQGDGAACANLGNAMLSGAFGQVLPVDITRAYERGCAGGDASSCARAGVRVLEGTGVARDRERGHQLLSRSCELDDPDGCVYLGVLLLEGEGAPRDPARALSLFEKACSSGHAAACENAGIVLVQGAAGAADPRRGAERFRDACELGLASACFNLGVAYYKGQGVLRDFVRAGELMQAACDAGYSEACEPAEKVSRQARSRVPGANVQVGSMAIDGLRVRELECRLDQVGSLGALALAATLAKQKRALDRCAPKGDAATVYWRFDGSATRDVKIEGVDEGTARCVAKAMKRVKGTVPALCAAIVLIGDEAGADAAFKQRE